MLWNSLKTKKFEVLGEIYQNFMIFQNKMQTSTIKIFVTTHPKNMMKISSNRASVALCKKIFVTQFWDIVAKI